MLDELGDVAFFAPMNAGAAPTAGWGTLPGAGAAWDRARFEQAASSTDPKEREKLFSALVKTRFTAYAQESRAFVDVDTGLAIMARHAAELGYAGVVLFLDELILWLSHRASESAWLHNEVQKMVKLVEAQESRRAIPIISFIARQRNLAEMVGEQYAGAEIARLHDSLKHWEGRYNVIALEDRNLPAIVERRVLKKKSPEAEKSLNEAFERLKRAAGASWQTMLGQEDAEGFRKLYPFSPALVEALVALSNSLQRERTAIKLLMELLVEHIEDLELGQVVGVGDLFDVLSGGEDAADGVMKARFEAAKQLYRYQFLPLIQEANRTTTEEACQRQRPGHPARIGCSNCPQKSCRSDNRLIKTLLIAALVPEVSALKNMTASRLVQLNHGSLKTPIPGTEASIAAGKLRQWGSTVGQLHVGSQADPTVRVQLEGVDLAPILEQAREHDTAGARQRVVRDLLFEAMGIDKVADWGRDLTVPWRNTKRLGHLRFANVRRLGAEALKCPDGHDFRVIIDYPFDDPGHGPNEDLETLDRFMDEELGSYTLVWLPSFFSGTINKLLGELVILEHIFEGKETQRRYVAHLSVENQGRAIVDLENLRNQKRARLMQVLEEAYGLAKEREGDLDPSASIDNHLHLLKPGVQIRRDLAANLSDALDSYVSALLEARYPRHPNFTKPLTPQRLARLSEKFGEIIDADDKRIAADRDLVDEMRGTLMELGLVRVTENAVHLIEDRTLQELERKRQQKESQEPTVGELRRWIDETGKMGLQPEASDLVVRCYARWATRTLVRYGKPFEAKAGQPLADDVVLEKPDLPGHAEWSKALTLAGAAFGVAIGGKALHADNLKRFEVRMAEELAAKAGPAARLPGLLRARMRELGLPEEVDRVRTAVSADQLCSQLQGKRAVEQVRVLASFTPETSAQALGKSIARAADAMKLLDDRLVFGVFGQLGLRRAELSGAEELLARVAETMRQDELHVGLAERLRTLAEEGQRILAPPAPPEIRPESKPERVLLRRPFRAQGKKAALSEVRAALEELERRIEVSSEDVTLTGEIVLSASPKSR